MKGKKITAAVAAAIFMGVGAFASCGKEEATTEETSGQTENSAPVTEVENVFSESDFNSSYGEDYNAILLSDGGSSSDSENVLISGDEITISGGGTYIVSGALSEGNIVVDCGSADVRLVLGGADITCSYSAAIFIKDAGDAVITLADGTENFISSTGFSSPAESNVDGAIFSKEDITFNGGGYLSLKSPLSHGIVSKDELLISGGTYDITAEKSAVCGKDCVGIAGGEITVAAGTDGIHAENSDDSSLGFVYIAGGTLFITAGSDGIEASSAVQLDDGTIKINADGKGIKAGGNMALNGGSAEVTADDDCFHANGNITVSGGALTASSGDDGFHSDGTLAISGGEITVEKSYEGLEGKVVEISGGKISVASSDDGINAAGGQDSSGFKGFGGDMFSSDGDCSVVISGGYLYINAEGDGIDSNGSLTVSGGETYVDGPTSGGNGALDYASSAEITGGTIVAVGTREMAENFTSATQGVIMYNLSSYTSGKIVLSQNGEELLSYAPSKKYNSAVISVGGLKQGETYSLLLGGTEYSITLSSLIYGGSASQNSQGGFRPGGNGGGGGRR